MFEIGTANFAISGFGPPSKPFRQTVAEIADCGYSHFLIKASEDGPPVDEAGDAPAAEVNLLASDLEALLRTTSSHGLRVSSIYPGFSLDFSDPDGTIDRLKAYRDIAWKLGCHIMIHSGGSADSPGMSVKDKKKQIKQVARVMDAISSDSPGEVFKMAVDIHYGAIIETVADCEYLLEHTKKKNSGLCLNMGHLTTSQERGWELLERYPDRIHILTWKDHDHGVQDKSQRAFLAIELGKGETPLHRYIHALRKVECKAPHLIAIEDVALDDRKDVLKRSYQLLQRMLSWRDVNEDITIKPKWDQVSYFSQ